MAFKALDIAKYIVDYCTQKNKSVSNLKLQKMLYYLWIEYYKITKESLFCDEICAWQFGPVVPDVYYEYCSYAGSPIIKRYLLSGFESLNILNEIIDKYIDITANELVRKSHEIGLPWATIYNNGTGNREVIPFELIIQLECNK